MTQPRWSRRPTMPGWVVAYAHGVVDDPTGRGVCGSGGLGAGAPDDGAGVDAAGGRAESEALIAAEPGRAERVGDGRVRVAQHERALQEQRHAFDEPAGAVLDRVQVGQLVVECATGGVEARVDAGDEVELGPECLDALGL